MDIGKICFRSPLNYNGSCIAFIIIISAAMVLRNAFVIVTTSHSE